MEGELVFEGSIRSTIKKKTKKAKWKLIFKQLNTKDSSVKLNIVIDGKKTETDAIIHNNSDQTVDVDGYIKINKKRKPISYKNIKLTDLATASNQKAELSALSSFM